MTGVWILGGYQSDFARNLSREGLDFADLTREIVDNTVDRSRIDGTDIGVIHVANAFAELFVRTLALPERISNGTHSTWTAGADLRRWRTADSAAAAVGL